MNERDLLLSSRLRFFHDEASKHSVAIVPAAPKAHGEPWDVIVSEAGSGTCIRIGGRFFIATAAHVIKDRDPKHHFIVTPVLSNMGLMIVGGGHRGGGDYDEDDVGWLELAPQAAASADRCWLDVHRVRTHSTGVGEQLVVIGSPVSEQEREDRSDGSFNLTTSTPWGAGRALHLKEDLRATPDLERRIYIDWPRIVDTVAGTRYENPPAPGMSGGGIWLTQLGRPDWRPDQIQLIGIENAWRPSGVPDRYLLGYQMQEWLKMIAEDVPELEPVVAPVMVAGKFAFR